MAAKAADLARDDDGMIDVMMESIDASFAMRYDDDDDDDNEEVGESDSGETIEDTDDVQ